MPEIEEETGAPEGGRTVPRTIEKEMESSYIDYAMSVIVGRALPDVRDGLKPCHRRILYAMNELSLSHDKPYKKSARVVGEVLGKYHPHGDVAVYDTMVRMAQPFSLRYPLVDGQGNFGSVDGDSAAAMRYTEARMSKIAAELLVDIEKDTVDFTDNFDATLKEPTVLPALLPNLLVNGSSGIAVGMATNMPPHNLGEVVDALCMLIQNPEVQIAELLPVLKGPDFPTAGIIFGIGGIVEAYQTGRGSIKVRSRTAIEEKENGRSRIIVTQLPYMVNKATLVESIAELVKDKKIEGISDIRDESDRDGMRIVVELKKDVISDVVLNQLFKHTTMESTFGVVNLALVDGKPHVLTIKQLLQAYLDHRKVIVYRRTAYDLKKAEERAHILEGLLIALDHLDEVITIIRASRTPEDARSALMARFCLSELQTREILDTKLQKLTGLEREGVKEEYDGLQKDIAGYKELLGDPVKIMGVIECEIKKLKEDFGDQRRTEIVYQTADLDIEDLIPNSEVIITITQNDYIKRQPLDVYRQQRRGGRGLMGMETKEEDNVVDVFTTRAHNYLLFFTSKGRVHWLKAYRIPETMRHSRGRPIINLLPGLEPGETIEFVIPVGEFDDNHWAVFATRRGVIKKTELSAYGNPRTTGIIAIILDEGDSVVAAGLSDGKCEVVLATRNGNAVRFDETNVRSTGRATRGVRGITLEDGDEVVSMALVRGDSVLLTITENGYGKRTPVEEYRKIRRGGKGVITINTNDRNGPVVAVMEVEQSDELIVTSQNGMVIRMPVAGISVQGRNTMGVRIMKLDEKDKVRGVDRIILPPVNGDAAKPAVPPAGSADEPPPPSEGCGCPPPNQGTMDTVQGSGDEKPGAGNGPA